MIPIDSYVKTLNFKALKSIFAGWGTQANVLLIGIGGDGGRWPAVVTPKGSRKKTKVKNKNSFGLQFQRVGII